MTNPSFPDDAGTWNERFAGEGYVFGTEPNAYLREHAAHWRPGSRLLCVADGEGRNSVWLAAQGMLVDAFDISEVGVAKARKLAAATGVSVEFSVSDCDSWPWQAESYDGVVAIFVQFADPSMRERLFANIIRSLKVGGILVLQGYSPKQLEYKTGGPSLLSHLYTEEMLRTAFASTEILELREEPWVTTPIACVAGSLWVVRVRWQYRTRFVESNGFRASHDDRVANRQRQAALTPCFVDLDQQLRGSHRP